MINKFLDKLRYKREYKIKLKIMEGYEKELGRLLDIRNEIRMDYIFNNKEFLKDILDTVEEEIGKVEEEYIEFCFFGEIKESDMMRFFK